MHSKIEFYYSFSNSLFLVKMRSELYLRIQLKMNENENENEIEIENDANNKCLILQSDIISEKTMTLASSLLVVTLWGWTSTFWALSWRWSSTRGSSRRFASTMTLTLFLQQVNDF